MLDDGGLMFFVNSKDIKLEGSKTSMAYEMGHNIWDFEWELIRHDNYDFLIFFKQLGQDNQFIETFTGTKYHIAELDNMVSEDFLVSFSMDKIMPIDKESLQEFKKQCEISSLSKMKRKMNKTYRKNRKAYKNNIEHEDKKVLEKSVKLKDKKKRLVK